MPSIRVAVVDDHQLVRIGLKQIIEAQSDFAWVGEAKNGREAIPQNNDAVSVADTIYYTSELHK